jgi:hypothetical protein
MNEKTIRPNGVFYDITEEETLEQIVESSNNSYPSVVFIVPYRDREQQLHFFARHMNYVLEDNSPEDYLIYYLHQCDKLEFNRWAMKNIGFLAIRDMYPNDYKNITLVFNDLDTMPYTKNFLNYKTDVGIVKHFYGYEFALGGIVSINAGDFERINGFPNFWAWGFEDNALNLRVKQAGLRVDRNQFYPIHDKNIIQFADGLLRNVSRSEFDRFIHNTKEGFDSIHNLNYQLDDTTGFIHVLSFETLVDDTKIQNVTHDLRKGNVPFKLGRGKMQLFM